MKSWMKMLGGSLAVAVVAVLVVPGARATGDDPGAKEVLITPKQLKWGPLPSLPPGAQVAVLFGAPSIPGPHVIRVKFPRHDKVPAHMHADDRSYTYLSGTLHEGEGDTFSEAAPKAIPAGSFHSYKAKTKHLGATKDKEAVFQVNGNGPTDITHVNSAGDPRRK